MPFCSLTFIHVSSVSEPKNFSDMSRYDKATGKSRPVRETI